MRDTVLVLTNSRDGQHTDVVISKLQKLGHRVFRFDVDKITTGELAITVRGDRKQFEYMAHYKGETLRLDEIKSVWYRRPNYFAIESKDPVQNK